MTVGRSLNLSLTREQAAFALSTAPFPAVVSGFGFGKTEALCARLLIQKLCNPKGTVGYYAPTFDLVKRVGWARIEEMLEQHKIPYKTNLQDKLIKLGEFGDFLFRTMESPSRLVGYEHSDAGLDELDTLKLDHAREVFERVLSRNRENKPGGADNTIAVATTPEGFRYVYETWFKNPEPGYQLYQGTTYSNAHNLPKNYIPNLKQKYSLAQIDAYLMGLFTNLVSGSVYPRFSRDVLSGNGTTQTENLNEPLHIGMDFNVYKMAAVVFVIRNNEPVAVGEFSKVQDTPAMIEAIKTRYGTKHKSISIYPDASGQNASSKSASVSDILLLRQAGFSVHALSQNPPVKDRVASVNGLIQNGYGHRRLKVNVEKCPEFAECLEQQVYDDNGVPDKKSNKDHMNDAAGYFMYRRWPVGRDSEKVLQLVGT